MKKEKKNKKLDVKEVKDSKKETKKKNLIEEKKAGPVTKKEKPATQNDVQPDLAVDHAAVKKLMIDSAVLYQNILVLPQTFAINGVSYSLYPSELKALDMIGQFSGINLTQLANKLSISKSAISKCTSKLLEKQLIEKEKSSVNVREVVFTLTPNGQSIFDQLGSVNSDLFEPFNKSFEELSPQEINDLHRMFLIFQSSLTEIINRV
ncbi:MAG: MarR family transcriptional regulator [Acetobacterium woodii]|nr:MarR family transcriptional regulator [Acetobacterium woodii]